MIQCLNRLVQQVDCSGVDALAKRFPGQIAKILMFA